MLYHLFKLLDETYNIPGTGLFQFISFRSAAAMFLSLLISMVLGKHIIKYLQKMQVGETIRDLGLEGQMKKQGTPTMGGLLIILCILLPTLLFARLDNVYIQLMIVSTIWMGAIGFIDDYIKVFKKDKRGLAAKFKIIGQVGLGLIVGLVLYFHEGVVIKKEVSQSLSEKFPSEKVSTMTDQEGRTHYMVELKRPITTIPFIKSHEFNYAKALTIFNPSLNQFAWIIFIPFVIIIITAVSNGANLTDGIDGLAGGLSFIALIAFWVICHKLNYFSLASLCATFAGVLLVFLYYNVYPARVFMGNVGSHMLGAALALIPILLHREIVIFVILLVFLVDGISSPVQSTFYKITKKRLFLMAPIHHHFEMKGWPETKVTLRFWLAGILCAFLGIFISLL